MINVLFVDDEPNILEGLQRTLRSMRREWEMSFAKSGADALDALASKNFDVVVSDMRMPGMDGAQLLQEVRLKYPHVFRLILSGYSDKEMILKSVGAAHQYLAKPCDADLLKATIRRAFALRDLLEDEELRRFVSRLHSIPGLPSLHLELADELRAREPSTKKIGEIIKKDIGMTAKILQVANSAFFGLKRQIANPIEAVQFLGLDIIVSLSLAQQIFSLFENNLAEVGLSPAELWNHSLRVGQVAERIAGREKPEIASDAFTAGLLHDIGRVALASYLPDQVTEAIRLAKCENLPFPEAEKTVFGVSQSQIGAYLLGLWGLSMSIVEAVAFHDNPSAVESDSFTVLTAVHIANTIVEADSAANETHELFFDRAYLEKLGFLDKLTGWQKITAFAGDEEIIN